MSSSNQLGIIMHEEVVKKKKSDKEDLIMRYV